MIRRHLSSAVLSAAVLAACGGGTGAPPAASVSKGVVTAKGSLTVNGVQFATTGAAVRFEDGPGTEADIKVGMVVKVKGTHDDRTGQATEIEFEDEARGQVDDKVGNVIRIGEQEIEVEHATEFEDNGSRLASIALGERVRVSGVPTSSGRIRATRIDKQLGSSSDFEVKGFVSGLSMGPPVTFTLRVTPDATSCIAVTAASVPAGVANGSFVEVRSLAPPAAAVPPATCASLTSSSMELEDARLGAENQEVEVEGLVTSGTSASFMVDGQAVVTNGTRWENGVADDLVPGVKVEAEGSLDSQTPPVLHADKVSFRANLRLQDTGANVVIPVPADPRTGSFTMLGVVTVLADEFTDWRGALDLNSIRSPLSSPVEVRGYRFTNSAACSTAVCVAATRVDSTNDTRLILQGPVAAKDASARTLGILGFTVATTAGTEFRDMNDNPITDPALFFAAVEDRTVVKARARDATALSGTTLTAERLEIEGGR